MEGIHDIRFLRGMSSVLRRHDFRLPDLNGLERRGELVFIPFGGSHVSVWTDRLAPLGTPEFHLYDHELPPESDRRQEAALHVNRRPGCHAVVTSKRSLENYLHPAAIAQVAGIEVGVDDFNNVAESAARELYQQGPDERPWEILSRRTHSRMTHRAKHWLNSRAVKAMTVELLNERDHHGELLSWFRTMAELIGDQVPDLYPATTNNERTTNDTDRPAG